MCICAGGSLSLLCFTPGPFNHALHYMKSQNRNNDEQAKAAAANPSLIGSHHRSVTGLAGEGFKEVLLWQVGYCVAWFSYSSFAEKDSLVRGLSDDGNAMVTGQGRNPRLPFASVKTGARWRSARLTSAVRAILVPCDDAAFHLLLRDVLLHDRRLPRTSLHASTYTPFTSVRCAVKGGDADATLDARLVWYCDATLPAFGRLGTMSGLHPSPWGASGDESCGGESCADPVLHLNFCTSLAPASRSWATRCGAAWMLLPPFPVSLRRAQAFFDRGVCAGFRPTRMDNCTAGGAVLEPARGGTSRREYFAFFSFLSTCPSPRWLCATCIQLTRSLPKPYRLITPPCIWSKIMNAPYTISWNLSPSKMRLILAIQLAPGRGNSASLYLPGTTTWPAGVITMFGLLRRPRPLR
ncbi:hypothetical protein B0H19DRAFT_1084091 [Mycena capillaripes]|nr:hypothetical protein B0H19DRAFT_1084091 [Mycena capillaripes]